MDLLQSCDEMKAFIETAQKLIDTWEQDPDNYSKLEEGLHAMQAELEKFKDLRIQTVLPIFASCCSYSQWP